MTLAVESTPVPGLLVLRLPVLHDRRGWFKENWNRAAMTALGLPDFGPVQHNVSTNAARGVTRGIHAEPWDKLVSVVAGRVFAAWVDLREGPAYGTTFHLEMGPEMAVFVPRGVGNSFQTLEDDTVYSYLVNEHWQPGTSYPALRLDDDSAGVPWPIPLEQALVSEKDRANPALADVVPVPMRRPLLLGPGGQLGRALAAAFPEAVPVGRRELDVTDAEALAAWRWRDHDLVLNATGYTDVEAAESPEGRRLAWRLNAQVPADLAALAQRHRFTLVHISTDYVFDGFQQVHDEAEPPSPLGVYAQSKAAGDLAAAGAPHHYLVRTSWLVGEGHNFVRTMARLADEGASPAVVDDQVGRITFATELAAAIRHLVDNRAPFGTYNCTNGGPPTSWADVARMVFRLRGRSPNDVVSVSTAEVAAHQHLAPRPAHSTLDLTRLTVSGHRPGDAASGLRSYLASLHTAADPMPPPLR